MMYQNSEASSNSRDNSPEVSKKKSILKGQMTMPTNMAHHSLTKKKKLKKKTHPINDQQEKSIQSQVIEYDGC